MQRCCVQGYHRRERERGNTAKKKDWDCLSMGLISAPQTMHPEDAYSLGVFWRSAWPDTHSRTAPRSRYVYTSRHDPYSSLSSPLESKYHNQNHSTSSPALVGMLKESSAQIDGVSLTQEEHYSMGIFLKLFLSLCAAPVVYCSTPRSSEGEQVNAPYGVREVWGAC